MKPVIVTKELISEGMAVMRGRDWSYNDQDVRPGGKGIVLTVSPTGLEQWATVTWEDGCNYIYRIGYEGKFDLYVYVPGFYKPKPQEDVRLSYNNSRIGLKIKLNENATGFAKGYLVPTGKTVFTIRGYDTTGVRVEGYEQTFRYQSFDICEDQTTKVVETKGTSGLPKYTTVTPEEQPVYKFRKGDIVYLTKADTWTDGSGIRYDMFYSVEQVNGVTFKLMGVSRWQMQDSFISSADYQFQEQKKIKLYTQTKLDTTPMIDLRELQGGTVAIAENSKTNKNSQNGTNTEPIKVRRPVSTIKGPKGRSGAIYSGRGSSSRPGISNH